MAARLTRAARDGAKELAATFAAAGTDERAVYEKAYMKSALRFHGVTMPEMRRLVRAFDVARPGLGHDGLVALADALYATDWFDLHGAAVLLLSRHVRQLGPADLPWLLGLARASACWAHVDPLATDVVGPVVRARPNLLRSLPRWARDEDVWVRRVALLAQLRELRAGRGDFELFARTAVPLLPDTSFWVRKAIGWVLRDVSRKRPAPVRAFVKAHGDAMSGVTRREATKYL